jgi:hypothetical protein
VIKPTERKLLTFALLSVVYWALVCFVILFTWAGTCGDMPSCDPTPLRAVIAVCAILYVVLATVFFRKTLSGLD